MGRSVCVFKESHLPSKYLPLPLPESPESEKELNDSIKSWSTSSLESQLVSSEGEVKVGDCRVSIKESQPWDLAEFSSLS